MWTSVSPCVQVRKAVEEGADWFVSDFDGFIQVVQGKRK
jgi:hypothetical protein